MSDNGTTLLSKEVDHEFFRSVGRLRGLKGSLYEGGIRVPAIVRWPGHVPEGATSDFVAGFEDWLPTFSDLINEPNNSESRHDGLSLLPTLLGQDQSERPFLYREYSGYQGSQSVRTGRWKALRPRLDSGDASIELYDLDSDAGERHDRAADHPEIVARLSAIMEREHTYSALFPLQSIDTSPYLEATRSMLSRLKALLQSPAPIAVDAAARKALE